ncbi:MAG: hypothetical protein JXP37_07000 [Coriobacteriia bacterium]|nr:hypothetical protein [Coriobacteriia bacterium]
MYQESEIVDFLMLVFLTPVMMLSVRAIDLSGKRWFVAGYLAIALGYVLTIIEGYIAPDLMNTIEHVSHGVAGICFLVGVVVLSRATRVSGETP